MTRTLYLIRHGQTEWNAEKRMQGQAESDLTALGREQAANNAEAVSALGVDAIFASPLRRARDSALALSERTGLPITFDARLMEWRAGDWSGSLYADIVKRWPQEWAAWEADRWTYRPPGAENFADLVDRGGKALADILRADVRRIAIVSHGFITRGMLAYMLALDPEDALEIKTPNDAFFRLREKNGAWIADRFEAGAGPFPGLGEDAAPPTLA